MLSLLLSVAIAEPAAQPAGLDTTQLAALLIAIIATLVGALVWIVKFMARQSDKHVGAMVGVLQSTGAEIRAGLERVSESMVGVERKLEEKLDRVNDSLTDLRGDMSIVRANTDHMVYGDVTPQAEVGREMSRGREAIPADGRRPRRG